MSESPNQAARVTIRSRAFGPGKGEPKRKPVSPAARKRLIQIFHTELVKKSPNPKIFVEGKTFERVIVDIRPAGRAAGIAQWLRDDGSKRLVVRAISILMGNIDPAADKKAFQAIRRAARRLPYPAKVYEEIQAERKPVIVTLFLDRKCYEEELFIAATQALAVAFFEPELRNMAK
jgi:hypothetical protein